MVGNAPASVMLLQTATGAVMCALLGTLFVIRPKGVQRWFQARHNESNFFKHCPFSTFIFKPWYPTYLRLMGAWIWIFALVFGYALWALIRQQAAISVKW
jgi:hypothetical protein